MAMLTAHNRRTMTPVCFFLCGIGSIPARIDFVKMLMDKYEVNPDKAF